MYVYHKKVCFYKERKIHLFSLNIFGTPQDPESQQSTREIAEQQARKSALAMVGSIVRVATELMIMGLGVGDETAVEVLGTAPLITMLLPLVLSHIGPVATSDPRVSFSLFIIKMNFGFEPL